MRLEVAQAKAERIILVLANVGPTLLLESRWQGFTLRLSSPLSPLNMLGVKTKFPAAIFTFCMGSLLCLAVRAQDQNWDNRFGIPNFTATVDALAVGTNGNLYAGGQFSGTPGFDHIAQWDGFRWSGLGSGQANGTSNAVAAILVQGTNVFVGGSFAGATNQNPGFLAMWDGSSWQALDAGTNVVGGLRVHALAGDGTNVYVGGTFGNPGDSGAINIARWDGAQWHSLSAGLGNSDSTVNCVAVAPDGSLYAAGSFTNSGAVTINRIARFDGSNWVPVGLGVDGPVQAIAFVGTNLYIAGTFTHTGASSLNSIGLWDGVQWQPVGNGLSGGIAAALASDGTNLYVGGTFSSAGLVTAARIARWNGTNWSSLSSGMNGTVDSLAVWNGTLYAGGDFTSAGGANVPRTAKWDGQHWSALHFALDGGNPTSVNIMRADGTNLLVAGNFTQASGVSANNIAFWNGSQWSALGSQSANGVDTMPWGLAISTNGQVYVGGFFAHAGGKPANGIARWDGTNWFALGTGLDSGGIIYSLVFGPDGYLYAGGRFTSMGGVLVQNVARWDGTNWWNVGGGLDATTGNPTILSLLFKGTNLYAGGFFDRVFSTASPAPGIAVWDGTQWGPVGPSRVTYSPQVDTLFLDGTNLYAGGLFNQIGGVNATNLGIWNGQNWAAVGPDAISKQVYSVMPLSGEVIIGGLFGGIGIQTIPGIARLIDGQWWPLGTGVGSSFPVVNTMVLQDGKVFVGGNFSQAGGKSVNSLAVWDAANELPVVRLTSPTNNSVFNGYQSIQLSAIAASPNGPATNVSFYVDETLVGVAGSSPYAVSWTNLVDGQHTLSARVMDITGAIGTDAVTATINLPLAAPIITQEPQSEKLGNGDSLLLTVVATGNGTLAYQWFKDGTAIAGATSSSLGLTNTQLGDSAIYTVQVSDSAGTNTSSRATISVIQPVTTVWTTTAPSGPGAVTSPAIGPGGTLYLGNDSQDLFAFAANSAYEWSYGTAGFVESSPSVATNGNIYFGSNDRNVYALTPDGDLLWTNLTGGPVMAPPALGTNGTIYVGSYDSKLYALNPDGSTQWVASTRGPIYSAAAVGADGTIYVPSGDSNLYAFSATGSNLWKFPTGGFGGNSPVIDSNGTIYIGSIAGRLYAISAAGSEKWHFTGAGAFSSSPVIGQDGTLYIANDGPFSTIQSGQNGKLYALSPEGTEKWEFTTAYANRSSPALSADGTIYFASYDLKLYALNPNGTEMWEIADDNPLSSPVIRFDGVIYAGSATIYAIQGTSPPAKSAWPTFLHDPRHTGNAATPQPPNGWFFPFGSNGFDDQVNAVAVSGADIYVGGNFRVAGGVPADRVAHWNGTNWFAMGEGLSGLVQALAVVGTNVYAGGQFTNVGGLGVNFLAGWDGSHWRPVGSSGLNEYVYALAANGGTLYAGGNFTTIDGIAANHVAQWDGSHWSALGSGASGLVTSMAVAGANLYVGQFSGGISRWDGTNWTSLGLPNNAIWAVAANDSSVYIGGTFTQINGVAASSIARWNGAQWLPLGKGVGDPVLPYVQSLTLEGTNLYVGGSFTRAGTTNANRIARWDGSNWYPLGAGINGNTLSSAATVNSIAVQGSNVFIGGAFLSSGGDHNIRQFAQWDGSSWKSVGPILSFVDGSFQFTLTDQIGRTYGIEASSDLKNWNRVATFTNLNSASHFIDAATTNLNRRFYRAVVP
jgi:trimeric autotransporter adhesin